MSAPLPPPTTSPPSEQQPQQPSTTALLRLQTFTIPPLPPSTTPLTSLTLTPDLPLPTYTTHLSQPFTIAPLPPTLTSLTLSLFPLGYPPSFLPSLLTHLPHLTSLTLYSQLITGTTPATRTSSLEFFTTLAHERHHLRELRLCDVFAAGHGFWRDVGAEFANAKTLQAENGKIGAAAANGDDDDDDEESSPLRVLEISYTYQPLDRDFLTRRIPPLADLLALITPRLSTLALSMLPPTRTNDEQDPTNLDAEGEEVGGVGAPEGVMTLPGAMSGAVVDRVGGLKGLRGLDLTLCAVGVEGLGRVVRAGGGRGLRVLSVAVEIEGREWWGGVFEGLSGGVGLEVVEVVGRPRGEVVEVMMACERREDALKSVIPPIEEVRKLGEKCLKLTSLKFNMLKTTSLGYAEWTKEDGEWKGGFVEPGEGSSE